MRFLRSLVSALVVVLLVGGGVIAATKIAESESTKASGATLAQVEDGVEEESTPADVGTAGAGLSRIESLLQSVFPQGEGSGLPSSQRVVLSRDPFEPVVPEEAPADGGTDGGGTDGGGTTGDGTNGDGTNGDGTDGNGTDGDGTDGDGTDECTGDAQEAVCDGRVVTLDAFKDGQAIVTVDETKFTVGVDDEFATSFRVLAINDPCATLLFGDEAFSICIGATVLK